MFYGYVESYGYLLVFTSAFLLSGVLVFQRRLPLWVASTFFGLAVFSHLTAAFAAPALLFLALFAPGTSRFRSLVLGLGPALLVFVASIVAHIALGYDQEFFRREFLEAQNTKNLWVSLTGEHRVLSAQRWIDLLNLGLLQPSGSAYDRGVARFQRIVRGIRLRLVQFLLLSTPRASRSSCSSSTGSSAGRGTGISSPRTGSGSSSWRSGPWLKGRRRMGVPCARRVPALAKARFRPRSSLGAVSSCSTWRAVDPRVSPMSPLGSTSRAYAYEELGKYYRNHNDVDRALEMYERCVETFPGNRRFQSPARLDVHDEGLRHAGGDRTARASPGRPRPPIGGAAFRSPSRPPSPGSTWPGVSRSRTGGRKRPAPTAGPRRTAPSDPRDLGGPPEPRCSASGDWRTRSVPTGDAASPSTPATRCGDRSGPRTWGRTRTVRRGAAVFRDGLRLGEDPKVLRYGIAASLVGQAERAVQNGEVPSVEGLAEAEQILRGALGVDPNDQEAQALYQRLRLLSSSPPAGSGR
ncbi:MAG: hypothetical protein R3E97_21610 [Candidatus Eisenbacteria bacterium]